MNRRFIVLSSLALTFLLPLSCFFRGTQEASANSAPPYWEGTTAAGAIVSGKQCPVEVEHEKLTLNIPRLPAQRYSSQEEFEKYDASVTAEYTFYNPTDMAVKMDLLFPFGRRPSYAFAGYDATADKSSYYDDTARYQIKVNGGEVERSLRYTYQGYSFSVDSMYLLSDEKREDDFFSPDLPVTEYRYTVDFPKKKDSGVAQFVLRYNPARTRILCAHYRTDELKNGDLHLYLYADKDSNAVLTFSAAGAAPQILSTAVKEDGYSWESDEWKKIEGAALRELSVETTTFADYIEAARPAEIGEVDFYNGALDRLTSFSYSRNGLISFAPEWLRAEEFMRWYAYSLEIGAGERLVNQVTAPLYPAIDYRTCAYEYLLSPAQKWADFGTLEIVIDTPLEIENASLGFTKTESGYTLIREGLPLGELTFEIEGDYARYPRGHSAWGIVGTVILVVVILGAALAVAGIVAAIVLGVRLSKKGKKN